MERRAKCRSRRRSRRHLQHGGRCRRKLCLHPGTGEMTSNEPQGGVTARFDASQCNLGNFLRRQRDAIRTRSPSFTAITGGAGTSWRRGSTPWHMRSSMSSACAKETGFSSTPPTATRCSSPCLRRSEQVRSGFPTNFRQLPEEVAYLGRIERCQAGDIPGAFEAHAVACRAAGEQIGSCIPIGASRVRRRL